MSDFYRIKFLSTRRGQLAVSLGCYIVGEAWESDLTGERFDHGAGRGDVVASGTLLPDNAPASFLGADGAPDAGAIWNAADHTGISTNKRHKRPKWKKRAQVGMHAFGALPADTTDEIRQEIVERHAEEFRRRGAAVTWAIHRPTDPESRNYHFHMLVSTRYVTPEGFGKQIRNLAAAFSRGKGHKRSTIHKDNPSKRWRAFVEGIGRERGLEFDLGLPQAVAGVHWGEGPRGKVSRNKELDAEAWAAAQALVRDPRKFLNLVTQRQAVFTRRDLYRILQAHEIPPDEADAIVARVLAEADILHLRSSATDMHSDLFTTRSVRAQEMRILAAARRIRERELQPAQLQALAAAMAKVAGNRPLSREQKAAMEHCLGADGLAIIQGIAGAGKSYTMSVIRQALELAGYRVIGVSPTNAVSADMAADGFHTASTIHQELLRQETQTGWYTPWNEQTVIVVDEAAMLDAGIYERLLVRAAEAGARIVLVGDDKQLSSIERGGIYAYLRKTFGCALLREVRRQNEAWAKEASLCFADGRILEGLQAYDERGFITRHDDIAAAAEALVRQRALDVALDPDKPRYVIAATRVAVRNLNEACQQSDWARNPPDRIMQFTTADGEVRLAAGDRVQFTGTDRKNGITNGQLATVLAIQEDQITVRADNGQTIQFDPSCFDKWGLGFAGTVFRSQGRTHAQVYCLYDHEFAWGASTSYVAFTRHKDSVRCYVPRTLASDIQTLASQMSKSDPRVSSLEFVSEEELRGEIPYGPSVEIEIEFDDDEPALSRSAAVVEGKHLTHEDESSKRNDPRFAAKSEIMFSNESPAVPQVGTIVESQEQLSDAWKLELPAPTDILPAGAGANGGGAVEPRSRQTYELRAMPFRMVLSEIERTFDLSLPEQESELLEVLGNQPMQPVVDVYRQIQKSAAASETVVADHLRGILRRITMQSQSRAFLPRDNRIYSDCLQYIRLDPQNILDEAPLRRRGQEVDIRSMVEPLYEIEPRIRRAFVARFKGFVIEALRAIDWSLGEASGRALKDEELQYSIILPRLWLYDETYARGLDLRPEITQELGRRATPEEYRDYIPLARKAEAAVAVEIETDPPEQRPIVKNTPKRFADSHILRELKLIQLYQQRLTDQIGAAETALSSARTRRQMAETTQRNPAFEDEVEAAAIHLDRLRNKLKTFKNDEYVTIRNAPALAFLPATITAEDVAAPRSQKFKQPEAAGFRQRDKAKEMLEDLLLGKSKPSARSPSTESGMSTTVAPQQRPTIARELE